MLGTEPEIIERYVRPGKVKLVFRAVLNHGERSIRTSEAAACAGLQGKFWQMHAILFERQRDVWGKGGNEQFDLMQTYAAEIDGLNKDAFKQCMSDRATLEMLQKVDAEQRKRGITFQPIFEIGDQRVAGAQSFEAMSTFIDKALAQSQ